MNTYLCWPSPPLPQSSTHSDFEAAFDAKMDGWFLGTVRLPKHIPRATVTNKMANFCFWNSWAAEEKAWSLPEEAAISLLHEAPGHKDMG